MSKQNILLTIFVLTLTGIGFVWYQYLRVLPAPPEQRQKTELESELNELERLATIEIKPEILQDPFFQSLEAPPAPEASGLKPGRENPFLPF